MSADRRDNLEDLKQELRDMRSRFEARADQLESAIRRIEKRWEDEDALILAQHSEVETPDPVETRRERAPSETAVEDKAVEVAAAAMFEATASDRDAIFSDLSAPEIPRMPPPEPEPRPRSAPRPREPGRVEEALNGVAAALAGLFAPLLVLLERAMEMYREYQRQGKAPVFLLTAAGIVAMLAGVGYLLRLSVGSLDAAGRTGIGFVAGVGFVIMGGMLARRRPDYRAYGSSLIGLGLAIAYLCTYFLGPYFELVGETISLAVLIGVTVVAYVLAVLFETRTVALVTLLGGAFTPFILGDSVVGNWYLGYLLLLATASIHLSRRIEWPLLGQLTILISIGLLETVEFLPGSHWWLRAALLHGFFYLFIAHLAWGKGGVKVEPEKSTLGMLTGLSFYLLYAGLNLPAPDLARGVAFLADGALLALAFAALKLRRTPLAPVAVLTIGLVTAGAIFVLAPPELGAALWTLEALSLIWLGFAYRHALIRIEGYTLGLLSGAALTHEVFTGFLRFDGLAFGIHWLALGGLLAAGLTLAWIARRNMDQMQWLDRAALWTGDEAATLLGVALVYLLLVAIDPKLGLVGVPVAIAWSLFRASRYQRSVSEIVGLAQLLIPLVYIITSTSTPQDLLVVLREAWTWWSLFVLVALGWMLAGLYETLFAGCSRRRTVGVLRWLTYCVPAVWCLVWALTMIWGLATGETASLGAVLLELAVMGIILFGVWALSQLDRCIDAPPIVREIHSVWFSMTVLYGVAIFFPDAIAFTGGLLTLAILAWALWRNRPASETFAWAHFAFPLYGIVAGAVAVGTLSFSSQTLITQLTWIQLFVVGWLTLSVYQWLAPERPTSSRAARTRALVYLALPLAFLPHVIRHYPLYVAASLWGSLAIAWTLHRWTKQTSLAWEVRLLGGVAALWTLTQWVDSPHPSAAAWIAIIAGLAALIGLVFLETGWKSRTFSTSAFAWPQVLAPYLSSFVIGALVFDLTGIHSWGWAATGGALLALQMAPAGRLLLGNRALAGGLAFVILAVAQWTIHDARSTLSAIVGFTLASTAMGIALFSNAPTWKDLRDTLGWTLVLQVVAHVAVVVGYSGISAQLTGSPMGVVTSICMVIHATVLLFTTINPEHQRLIRFAVALFAIAAGKVLLVDMRGFNMTHKMIMLLVIGGVLLGGAFLYQRLQGREAATEPAA